MKIILVAAAALAVALPANAQTYGGGVYFPQYNPPQGSGFLEGYRASRGMPSAPVYVNPPAPVFIAPQPPVVTAPPVAPVAPMTRTICNRIGEAVYCNTY